MTRGDERWIRRMMYAAATLLLMGSMGVLAFTFFYSKNEDADAVQGIKDGALPNKFGNRVASNSPLIERLQQTKFSKTLLVTKQEKASGPPLFALVRLKGIMDFGNPKACEALIEIISTGQIRTYKVGDALDGVPAVIEKIDSVVTLKYEGASVKLEMANNDRTSLGPIATPDPSAKDVPGYTSVK